MRAGFNHTDIGLIPDDWESGRIDDYFTIQQGKSVSKENRVGNNQKPFLRTSNLLWGKVTLKELDFLHFSKEEEIKFRLQFNDLLVCEGGDIGRTAIWKNEMNDIYYQNHLHRVRAKVDDIDPAFILCWMQYAFQFGKLYFGRANITTIPNLSKSRLSEFTIPKPPVPEQRKIAYILSTLQKAIEQQDKLIRQTTELKKALMQKLFTEGTKGEKQKQTEIGLVPESCNLVEIQKLFNIQQGKQVSKSNRVGSNQRPFLRTANVYWGSIDFSELDYMHFSNEEEKKYTLCKDDLLLCEGGDVGRTAIWEYEFKNVYYQNHLHRLRRISEHIIPKYFMYWMNYIVVETNYVKDAGNRTTIPNLSKSRLGRLFFPLSSMDYQKKGVAVLENLDKKIKFHQNKKQILSSLFKTLLHELMTGKRRIHHLNFNIN